MNFVRVVSKGRNALRHWLLLVATALPLLALADAASAQAYPSKPITMILPYGSGTGDSVQRLIAEKLSGRVGQPVIVMNRPGGSDVIASQALLAAPPDGHAFMAMTQGLMANPHIRKVPYEVSDFAPLTFAYQSKFILVSHPSVAAKTFPELMALGKAQPNKLSFGYAGTQNFGIADLAQRTGVTFLAVPFQSGGPGARTAVLAGDTLLHYMTPTEAMSYAKTDKVRMFAITSAKRAPEYPDIPAISEFVPGYEFTGMQGYLVAAKVAPSQQRRLSDELRTVLKLPEVTQAVAAIGNEVVASSPEELAQYIQAKLELWGRLAKQLGIVPN